MLDEIQRLPELLNEVHRFIEERRLRFVLCGSSARKLKQQGTNHRVGPDELRGLRAIQGMKGLVRRILVFRGPRRLQTSDGIDVWPIAALLEALGESRLWP